MLLTALDVHVGLVRLNDNDRFALRDLVSFALQPRYNLSLSHGRRKRRHKDLLDRIAGFDPLVSSSYERLL